MARRIAAVVKFLELGAEEAQWLALIVALGLVAVFGALMLGIAVRVFACAGGMTC